MANYTYTFQMCANTLMKPVACGNNAIAPAYQVDASGSCYELGQPINQRPYPITWGLVDTTNPARGVAMTYTSGSITGSCPVPRSLTVNFICAPMPFPVAAPPSTNRSYNGFYWIDEVSQCQYVANSYSLSGCPKECPVTGGQLCSGNGVCGFDVDAATARCYCNDDYIESDCSAPRYPFPTGAVAGSAIGGIVLGIAAVVGAIVLLQRRRASMGGGAVDGFYGIVQ